MFLTLLIIGIALLVFGLIGKLVGLTIKVVIFLVLAGLVAAAASFFFR